MTDADSNRRLLTPTRPTSKPHAADVAIPNDPFMQIHLVRIAQWRFFASKAITLFLSSSIFWQCHVTMTPF